MEEVYEKWPNFITAKDIISHYNVSNSSLHRWHKQGKVSCIRTSNNGKRLYDKESVKKFLGVQHCSPKETKANRKQTISYARVSSTHQKEDLERQCQFLQEQYPDSVLIKDVASGINFKRHGLVKLLDKIYNNEVERVVVTYKDRLSRFGLELFEWIFEKHNVKFMVLRQPKGQSREEQATQELQEDLLSVVSHFVARHHGSRSHRNKVVSSTKNQIVSEQRTTEDHE